MSIYGRHWIPTLAAKRQLLNRDVGEGGHADFVGSCMPNDLTDARAKCNAPLRCNVTLFCCVSLNAGQSNLTYLREVRIRDASMALLTFYGLISVLILWVAFKLDKADRARIEATQPPDMSVVGGRTGLA